MTNSSTRKGPIESSTNYKPSLERPADQITVRINGETEKLPRGTTLAALLTSKEMNPNIVACELNLKIVRRSELANEVLREDDVLEIFRMIGGG